MLADYAANAGWTLTYTLIPQSGTVITITAIASSDTFVVLVASAVTAAYATGAYKILGHVSDGTNRYKVYESELSILADITSAYDYRTFAEKQVDALKATIATLAARYDQENEINGMRHIVLRDLTKAQENLVFWENRVRQEQQGNRNKKILGRFVNA